jgi:lysophospholipase L1-like esterase
MTDDRSPVLFLGDSITEQGDWDTWLPDEHTLNQGIGGDTTDGVLTRLDAVVAEQPEVIVLLIGTNDFGNHRASAEHVVRNVETILVTLRRELPGVRLLLVSILPRQAEYATKIEQALADGDHLDARFTEDGLHLTEEGYRALVGELVPALERVRDLPPMSRSIQAIDLDGSSD